MLFLGFSCSAEEVGRIEQTDSSVRRLCFAPGYLEWCEQAGFRYLGKAVASGVTVDQMELLGRHLVSLWSRLFPQDPPRPLDALVLLVCDT